MLTHSRLSVFYTSFIHLQPILCADRQYSKSIGARFISFSCSNDCEGFDVRLFVQTTLHCQKHIPYTRGDVLLTNNFYARIKDVNDNKKAFLSIVIWSLGIFTLGNDQERTIVGAIINPCKKPLYPELPCGIIICIPAALLFTFIQVMERAAHYISCFHASHKS